MKNIMVSLVIIFIGYSGGKINAQSNIIFGVKAGPNLRTAFLGGAHKDPAESASILLGLHIGGILEIQNSEQFKIQTGISLLSKGFKYKDTDFDYFEKITVVYIEAPLNFYFNVSDFWIGGGPYFAIATGGKAKDDSNYTDILSIGNTDNDDWAPLDIGLGLSGFKRVGPVDVGIGIEFGFLNNIPKETRQYIDFNINNFNINFFAAYMFED